MSDDRHTQGTGASPETSSPQLDFMMTDSTPARSAAIPHGVNAQSWLGFEQRIRERRLRAVHETLRVAIIAGDTAGARAALEEARELQPESGELRKFEALVARMPSSAPGPASEPFAFRVATAALLLLVGFAALFGLDWARAPEAPEAAAAVAAPVPAADSLAFIASPATDDTGAGVVAAEAPLTPADAPSAIATTAPEAPALLAPEGTPRAPALTRPAPRSPAPGDRPVSRLEMRPSPPAVTASSSRAIATSAPASPASMSPPANDEARSAVQVVEPVLPLPSATALSLRAPVATPAAALGRPAAAPSPAAAVGDEQQIARVLERYARAYADLDARAAREIWPTVDERALARAFDNLASQQVSFERCAIAVDGPHAEASCQGQASYVGKVGNGEPRIEPRAWRFSLRRVGEAWKIESAAARRAVTESH